MTTELDPRKEQRALQLTGNSWSLNHVAIVVIALLLFTNILNFGTVLFTLQGDGKSLHFSEAVLSRLCHRMPSRCFWLLEVPLGLCSRCTGVYISMFLSMILLSIKHSALPMGQLRVAVVFLIVLPIEGLLEHLGVYSGNNGIRFSTGVLFGVGLTSLQACLCHRFRNETKSTTEVCNEDL